MLQNLSHRASPPSEPASQGQVSIAAAQSQKKLLAIEDSPAKPLRDETSPAAKDPPAAVPDAGTKPGPSSAVMSLASKIMASRQDLKEDRAQAFDVLAQGKPVSHISRMP